MDLAVALPPTISAMESPNAKTGATRKIAHVRFAINYLCTSKSGEKFPCQSVQFSAIISKYFAFVMTLSLCN